MPPKKNKINPAFPKDNSDQPGWVDSVVSITLAHAQIDRIMDSCAADIEKILAAHSNEPESAAFILENINIIRQMTKEKIHK